MIGTSYFAKYKGDKGVSIALYSKFWKGETYYLLAPTKSILEEFKRSNDEDKYISDYSEKVLGQLDVHKVYKDLDGKVLLCYEKSNGFCHRHIVAKWFRENGYECEEL